jgi:hypothetical protein
MAVKLSKLLEVIPSDTETVVARARDEINQAIRERLRQLTGFRFGGSRKSGAEDELADAMPVRVALAPGFPAQLADKSIEEEEWALALLALHRPALEQLKGGSHDLLSIVPQLLRDPVGERLLDGRDVPLKATHHLAEDLLRAASGFDLAKRILAVEGDVLGAYFPPQRKWHTVKPPHIELSCTGPSSVL